MGLRVSQRRMDQRVQGRHQWQTPSTGRRAADWTYGVVALICKAQPPALARTSASGWIWNRGVCRDARMVKVDEALKAPFCITGEYARWKQVLRKELDPIKGMMQGKLKLKGDLPTIVRAVKAAQELVNSARPRGHPISRRVMAAAARAALEGTHGLPSRPVVPVQQLPPAMVFGDGSSADIGVELRDLGCSPGAARHRPVPPGRHRSVRRSRRRWAPRASGSSATCPPTPASTSSTRRPSSAGPAGADAVLSIGRRERHRHGQGDRHPPEGRRIAPGLPGVPGAHPPPDPARRYSHHGGHGLRGDLRARWSRTTRRSRSSCSGTTTSSPTSRSWIPRSPSAFRRCSPRPPAWTPSPTGWRRLHRPSGSRSPTRWGCTPSA